MTEQDRLRVAILGSVSVGKSTLVNSIFVKQFSKTKIKRTTMLPCIFSETNENIILQKVRDNINFINNNLIEKTEKGYTMSIDDCKANEYKVSTYF